MLSHHNIMWTVESLKQAHRLRHRARRQAPGVVPADGPHRRAHDEPLHAGDRRLRGHQLPRPGPDRGLPPRGAARTSCSACRACGRSSTPASWPRSPADPDEGGAVRRGASRRPSPIVDRTRLGHGRPRSRTRPWEFLDDVAFDPRAGHARPRPGRVRDHRRGADPGRAARVVPRHRRAAVRDLRHVRVLRPDDLGAGARQARHRRSRHSRAARSNSPTTARSSAAAATSSSATSTTPRRRPRRSTPTAGCTPATSARSTTTATSRSSTARRS